MKKSLIIFTLALLQSACATQEPITAGSDSLLSFAAISVEISVNHVETEAADDLSRTLALNTSN